MFFTDARNEWFSRSKTYRIVFIIFSFFVTPFTFCFMPPFDFYVEEEPGRVNMQLGPMNLRVKYYHEQAQDPIEKVFANVAACCVGAMCGYVLKAMWEDAGTRLLLWQRICHHSSIWCTCKSGKRTWRRPYIGRIFYDSRGSPGQDS